MSFKIPWMSDYNAALAQELRNYEELEIQVKMIIGYDFKCLLELFKMGYTLQRPETDVTLTEIAKLIEEKDA